MNRPCAMCCPTTNDRSNSQGAPRAVTRLAALLALVAVHAGISSTPAAGFALKKGERVVFMGDTLIADTAYANLVESFVRVRYPDLDPRFFTFGWSNETATQGLARLQRDVLSLRPRPTVAVINYGMYDANFEPFDQNRYDRYIESLETITQRLSRLGCRVWIVTPMSVDEDRDPSGRLAQIQYNQVLARYADGAADVARKQNAQVLDLYRISLEGRAKERQHNRRFAYTRNGRLPTFVAAAMAATELLKAWKAEPTRIDITLDWQTKQASAGAGKITVKTISPTELELKLTNVPLLWPYAAETRTTPMHWPLGELSRMLLKIENCPEAGILLGHESFAGRALPMLKMQLDPGLDLARFEPVRSLEPIKLVAELIEIKNRTRTEDLWRRLLLKPVTQPELREAYESNIKTLELYVDGYRAWVQNTPKRFDVLLRLTEIVPGNVSNNPLAPNAGN